DGGHAAPGAGLPPPGPGVRRGGGRRRSRRRVRGRGGRGPLLPPRSAGRGRRDLGVPRLGAGRGGPRSGAPRAADPRRGRGGVQRDASGNPREHAHVSPAKQTHLRCIRCGPGAPGGQAQRDDAHRGGGPSSGPAHPRLSGRDLGGGGAGLQPAGGVRSRAAVHRAARRAASRGTRPHAATARDGGAGADAGPVRAGGAAVRAGRPGAARRRGAGGPRGDGARRSGERAVRAGAPGPGGTGPWTKVPTGVRREMPTTRTKKVDTGTAPAEKAKKPLGRKSAPAAKARKTAPAKTATKKRTLAVVQAGATPAPRRGGRYLVVVESPAKAKTIKKYLGTGYAVKAAAGAERVYLATDPDREGEAIAWHLSEELRHPDAVRVLFNEITKKAIQEAIAHPLALDQKMYDSQQTRRILDRLVGYQISPLLWKKVRRGLSAGRVQSVAVRLIVEREREIKAFVPVEYWTLEAELEGKSPPPFRARLAKLDGKKAEVADKATADALLEELRKADYRVETVERRERRRNAAAPFI